jgi:hypothetical protein
MSKWFHLPSAAMPQAAAAAALTAKARDLRRIAALEAQASTLRAEIAAAKAELVTRQIRDAVGTTITAAEGDALLDLARRDPELAVKMIGGRDAMSAQLAHRGRLREIANAIADASANGAGFNAIVKGA